MAGSLSIAAAFVFMLVLTMTTANPVHNKEKLNPMLNQIPSRPLSTFGLGKINLKVLRPLMYGRKIKRKIFVL